MTRFKCVLPHTGQAFILSFSINAKEAHRKTGRLLDIGTGTGYFADTMVRRGWKAVATPRRGVQDVP